MDLTQIISQLGSKVTRQVCVLLMLVMIKGQMTDWGGMTIT